MKYILNPHIALRGWRLVPQAYYIRGSGAALGLSQNEFEFLIKCDGQTDIPFSSLLVLMLERGLCAEAKDDDRLADWQRYKFCNNRYFPAVNWAITGKCNFNCRHCFNAADNNPLMSEFSWEQCQEFIQQLDECGVQNFTLTGGEPMLHPYFMDICREINRRGLVVEELTTNGSYITSQMLDEFAEFHHRPLFKLSFDGIGHHDWFRMKEGAECEVIQKTKLLRDKGFRVRFQTNVHKGNTNTLFATAKLADEMGVEGIRIVRTTEAPRWEEMGRDLCLSINEYYDFALDFIHTLLGSDLKLAVDIWQVLQLWPLDRTYHHRPVEGGVHKYRDTLPVCRSNRGTIAVTSKGEVVPCNQMSGWYKKHGIHIGNVHETSLRELLTGGKYLQSVCCTVEELREENPECQACLHWKLCMGGCRALGILFGGSYKKYDSTKCVYFNEYFSRFTALFDESWHCIDDTLAIH